MFHQCQICLDDVIIPVEITVFPCYLKKGINCFSIKRICEQCAILYLELNKTTFQKSNTKKCIFCSATIPLKHINEPPYKKDFLLMSMDPRKNLKCPYCDVTASHLELERHVSRECKNINETCLCGKVDRREIIQGEHKLECCFFKQCCVCKSFINKSDYQMHLLTHHNLNYCQLCDHAIVSSIQEHLRDECIMRIIKCTHCNTSLVSYNYLDHLIHHASESKKRIKLLNEIRYSESIIYENYVTEIQELYESTYGVPFEKDD
jgi:hypothetical protein